LAASCFGTIDKTRQTEIIDELAATRFLIEHFEAKGCWFRMEALPYKWLNGEDVLLIMGIDHSQYITNEEMLTIKSYTDELTGIYNRKAGLEIMSKFMSEQKSGAPVFTVCVYDLDNLHYINESFGTEAGDQYILTITDLVKRSIRRTDIFARLDGDQFIIIFAKCASSAVATIFQEISKRIDATNRGARPRLAYALSYGIVEVSPDNDKFSDNIDNILEEATAKRLQMKAAKKS
jgi:diguanylate cyclase (GGDEF)-like protein